MSVKLVCIDLDGTLLNRDGKVSQEDKKAIQKCLDEKVHVFVTTGRPLKFAQSIADTIDSRIEIIAFNGAFIESKALKVRRKIEEISKIVNYLDLYQLECFYKSNESIYALTNNDNFNYDDIAMLTHQNFSQIIQEGIIKVVGVFNKSPQPAIIYDLLDLKSDYEVVIYDQKGFEITAKQAHKGSAIQLVQQTLGISKNETMCFGDSTNDLTMFEQCHYSVAMLNSTTSLKEKAWKVTLSHNDSGVAHLLNQRK